MALVEKTDINFRKDWPKAYYQTLDLFLRKDYLNQVMEDHKNSEDEERLRLYSFRYDLSGEIAVDRFVAAWTRMHMFVHPSYLQSNLKNAPSVILEESKKLGILDYPIDDYLKEEWRHFARTYIKTCHEGNTYKGRFLSFFKLSNEQLCLKIAEDIDYGTRAIPNIASLSENYAILREIMIEEYKKMIEDGEKFWNQYQASL